MNARTIEKRAGQILVGLSLPFAAFALYAAACFVFLGLETEGFRVVAAAAVGGIGQLAGWGMAAEPSATEADKEAA